MKHYYKLLLLGLFTVSPFVQSATGVAFIHGTGDQSDALNDYWNQNFVNTIRQGISNPNNYLVINCNFDQYMWDNAASGCLAGQLTQFIESKNLDSLTLITHSNGGKIGRASCRERVCLYV